MRYLKLFEEFNQDAEFEFLANIPKMIKAIIKIVEVHERYYYNDNKISTNQDFISEIKKVVDRTIKGEETFTEDYLEVVKTYENELYNENEFNLNNEHVDESMFVILDEFLSYSFKELVKNKNKSVDDVENFEDSIDGVIRDITTKWVYQKRYDDELELRQDDNIFSLEGEESDGDESEDDNIVDFESTLKDMWKSQDEFIEDIEGYIGKKLDDFEYGDRLQAFKYVENKPWVKETYKSGHELDIDYLDGFLEQMKEILFDL